MITTFLAQIGNPFGNSVDPGGNLANPLVSLIVSIWRAAIIAGGLALLLYLIWGSIEWLTSGGDKEKLTTARGRILNAIIGMALLVGSVAIIALINALGVFGNFNLLNMQWTTP